jgi:hypothetical protein
MATDTKSETVPLSNVTTADLAAGAVGGFLGSALFGLIMQFVMPAPVLGMAVPAMYGIEGPALAAGWAIHQFHGVVLGVAYVVLVRTAGLDDTARSLGGAAGLGVGYGVLTTLLPVIVMPLWLQAVGFAGAPPFPNLAVPATIITLIGHVVYALPVAVAYALVASD